LSQRIYRFYKIHPTDPNSGNLLKNGKIITVYKLFVNFIKFFIFRT
jgi:hypothetical protein